MTAASALRPACGSAVRTPSPGRTSLIDPQRGVGTVGSIPTGWVREGRPAEEVAMPLAPSAAAIRQQSVPRNLQDVPLNLILTGRSDRPPPTPRSLTPDIFARGDST